MRHLLSFLTLSLLLLASIIPLQAAESVWNGKTIATSFYGGTGTKSDPYTIYTASQFAYFYKEMANGRTFEGEYISLKNDIDMTQKYLSEMDGIENSYFDFRGNFDGEDHSLAAVSGALTYEGASNGPRIFGNVYGTIYNLVFSKYQTKIAQIRPGGELYNCKLEKAMSGALWTDYGGMVANCYCNANDHWQNSSKYGGASGLCDGNGACCNCQFTGMSYVSYGNTVVSNYGGDYYLCENNGVTEEEHNQWVLEHNSSTKTYKSWPLSFNPTYPSYTVTVSFADGSTFTNYTNVQRTAGTDYTLPTPIGFETEFLGWQVNGEIVKTIIPTDQTECIAQWRHAFAKLPTLLNPTAAPLDKSKTTVQWYHMPAKKEYLTNTITSFEVQYDNALLDFDYSVWSSSGGYFSDGYNGELRVDDKTIVYCSSGKQVKGHYQIELSKGEHTIYRDAASTQNITLSYPSTPVGSSNTYQLDLSNIIPDNGVYYCEATYGSNKIYSDTLDTSELFYVDEKLFAPTSATEVALLKTPTEATTSLIPQTVIDNEVEYTITGISDYAFAGCSSLQRIICMQTEPLPISSSAAYSVFKNVNKSTCRLLVPTSSISKYQTAIGWRDFVTIKSSTVVPAKIYQGNNKAYSMNADLEEVLEQEMSENGLVFIDDQDVDQTLPANFVKKDDQNQWIASSIELTDAMPLYSPADLHADMIAYYRTFSNTNWQAWYVPFDMPYVDIEAVAKIAYINNVHQYDDDDDGEIDRTILEFISVKNGVIEGNTPYVVKPNETGDITFETANAKLMATADNELECQSTRTRYIITGNYQPKTDMFATGAYAMSQGNWRQSTDASAVLQPFRISMVIVSKNAAHQANAPMRIEMTVDGMIDEDAAGLIDVYMQDENTGDIYNLKGQKVEIPAHGIYFKNGKKYLQK